MSRYLPVRVYDYYAPGKKSNPKYQYVFLIEEFPVLIVTFSFHLQNVLMRAFLIHFQHIYWISVKYVVAVSAHTVQSTTLQML
jgi:hypothetical protein